MALSKVRLSQIEDGETLIELIRWYKNNKNDFVRRFNALRDKTRKAFENSGYTLKDVDRLIAKVRTNK